MSNAGNTISLANPNMGTRELGAVQQVLESGWVTQGPQVQAFEREFAAVVGAEHAVAVTSGTAALMLMFAALDLPKGSKIVVPSYTWVACANAIVHAGHHPVFCDVDLQTCNINWQKLSQKTLASASAILMVHQFGLKANIEGLQDAHPHLTILEDAACSLGTTAFSESQGLGSLAQTHSFHPRKLVCSGEGGMVVTDSSAYAEHLRSLRNHGLKPQPHGQDPLFAIDVQGYNYRLSDILAAIGRVQLKQLPSKLKKRQELAKCYVENLKNIQWLDLPPLCDDHAYQSFVIQLNSNTPKDRGALMAHLAQYGIESRPGTHAIHLLPAYAQKPPRGLSAATHLNHQALALPMHDGLTPADVEKVAKTLGSF